MWLQITWLWGEAVTAFHAAFVACAFVLVPFFSSVHSVIFVHGCRRQRTTLRNWVSHLVGPETELMLSCSVATTFPYGASRDPWSLFSYSLESLPFTFYIWGLIIHYGLCCLNLDGDFRAFCGSMAVSSSRCMKQTDTSLCQGMS